MEIYAKKYLIHIFSLFFLSSIMILAQLAQEYHKFVLNILYVTHVISCCV